MSNLNTFLCASCGTEFVRRPGSEKPVCPACGAELKGPSQFPEKQPPETDQPAARWWLTAT
ncbi:MAG TPA: zinc ribbon domain-containing protein [Bryobacterales bacterium]|nr:zinc ribbon domain-containing protein [Bryobacterales bacterium]